MARYRAKADGAAPSASSATDGQTVEHASILELDLRKALANEEFDFLPAAGQSEVRKNQMRNAAALESSGPRHVSPIDIFPSPRYGLDRRSRALDPAQGLHGMHEVAEAVSVAVNFSPQHSTSATC